MDYFIFKNRRSDDVGIIIERLPPITKPPRKYSVREISGVDGSEIDLLGYGPYEKIIPIGFREKNIHEIVNWLDGQGKLIMSNEPHVYYDAVILNQIDYEKALRFRKAELTFYVQPYKYAIGEEETTARTLYNQGNVNALPLMTIRGSGQVILKINGVQICTLIINGSITLDSLEEEAYRGTVLQNRFMIGEFPVLVPGENTITFSGSGTVTEVTTLVRSRWL